MKTDVKGLSHREINEKIRAEKDVTVLGGVCGQRFIGAGMSYRTLDIEGVPGNALGAYLNGGTITVHANAQDAVGDTMNAGEIIVHGNIGDAAGYAMRGGAIYVKGNAGYRAGIHMKAYEEKVPLIVIGGHAGSFLGEYQAGGVIVVLGLSDDGKPIVGNYPCTGMHGGRIYFRGDVSKIRFPAGVTARAANSDDLEKLSAYVRSYCTYFGANADEVLAADFTVVEPDSKNPYKQMYVAN